MSRLVGLALVSMVASAQSASAIDELVPGKLVVIKNGRRAKFVARAPAGQPFALPFPPAGPSIAGGSLRFVDTGLVAGSVSYTLHATGWKGLGTPAGSKGFRYRGRDATPPDDVCRLVLVKPKVIKGVCQGDSSSVPLAPPFAGNVVVQLALGTEPRRYCAEFGGQDTRNDSVMTKRKKAPAPGDCFAGPATPSVLPTSTQTPANTQTPSNTPTPSPTATPAPCQLTAGSYTATQLPGGQLTVSALFPFPFPSGGTIVHDVGPADPNCVHDVVVPFPGGFSVPTFCINALGFSVSVVQSGCGVGEIDSNGGSDYTIAEVGDTSDSSPVCNLPQTCTAGSDSSGRVDITVGDGSPDLCSGGIENMITSVPVFTTVWFNVLTCPDPDGTYDPGTDTLIVSFPQTLDLTTDATSADFADLDGDGCCLAGAGPASVVQGDCTPGAGTGGLSGTGACLNTGGGTVTLAAAGPVPSSGAPLYDLTFATVLPNSFAASGPLAGATCAVPPIIPLGVPGGTATRCIF